MDRAIDRAVAMLGGQTALAKVLKLKQGHVWYWLNRSGRVPAEHVLAIELATDGRVTRHDLRPDIYPSPPKRKRPANGEEAMR